MQRYTFTTTLVETTKAPLLAAPVPYLAEHFGASRLKVAAQLGTQEFMGTLAHVALSDPKAPTADKSFALKLPKKLSLELADRVGQELEASFVITQFDGAALMYYDCLLKKALSKKRSQAEFEGLISQLTGYTKEQLKPEVLESCSYASWLEDAPNFSAAALELSGKICGVDVSRIGDATLHRMRVVDLVVDKFCHGAELELLSAWAKAWCRALTGTLARENLHKVGVKQV